MQIPGTDRRSYYVMGIFRGGMSPLHSTVLVLHLRLWAATRLQLHVHVQMRTYLGHAHVIWQFSMLASGPLTACFVKAVFLPPEHLLPGSLILSTVTGVPL